MDDEDGKFAVVDVDTREDEPSLSSEAAADSFILTRSSRPLMCKKLISMEIARMMDPTKALPT